MTRYLRIAERLRRPLAALAFGLGVLLLAEALRLDRGLRAYVLAVCLLAGSLVWWLVPFGRRLHPPSESTLQWARHRRSSTLR